MEDFECTRDLVSAGWVLYKAAFSFPLSAPGNICSQPSCTLAIHGCTFKSALCYTYIHSKYTPVSLGRGHCRAGVRHSPPKQGTASCAIAHRSSSAGMQLPAGGGHGHPAKGDSSSSPGPQRWVRGAACHPPAGQARRAPGSGALAAMDGFPLPFPQQH